MCEKIEWGDGLEHTLRVEGKRALYYIGERRLESFAEA